MRLSQRGFWINAGRRAAGRGLHRRSAGGDRGKCTQVMGASARHDVVEPRTPVAARSARSDPRTRAWRCAWTTATQKPNGLQRVGGAYPIRRRHRGAVGPRVGLIQGPHRGRSAVGARADLPPANPGGWPFRAICRNGPSICAPAVLHPVQLLGSLQFAAFTARIKSPQKRESGGTPSMVDDVGSGTHCRDTKTCPKASCTWATSPST